MIHFADGDDRTAISKHWEKTTPYLWQSAVGMTGGGSNCVQCWDTFFAIIAVADGGLAQAPEFKDSMLKDLEFLEVSQIREDLADPYRRQRKGG